MPTLRAGLITVTLFQQNCLLLWDDDTKAGTVIDPGGEVDRIQEAIKEQSLKIEKILLTHGHIDHAGGAAELAEALGVPIEGPHKEDMFLLDGLPEAGAEFGMDDARTVSPDRWLKEGDKVEFAGFAFDVLHCPGHTPGHVVFIDEGNKFAVLGDVLFRGSIGRTDFAYGDHAALIDAIKNKLLPLGDDITFFCGHGPPSTIGDERRTNPFLE